MVEHNIFRPAAVTKRMFFSAAFVGGVALLFWWWVSQGDATYDKVAAAIFTAQSLWITYSIVARKISATITSDGIKNIGIFKRKSVLFSDITWINIPDETRAGVIAHRPAGGDKEKIAAFSKKLVGPEGVAAIRQAILDARPAIPQTAPGAKIDPVQVFK